MGPPNVSPAGGYANGTREVIGMQSGDGASDDIVWVRRYEGREKMSTDNRQLIIVNCIDVDGSPHWHLRPLNSERVASGLYLMIPVDDVEQSKQIVTDMAVGMRARG
jgi:hypothetical protein